MPRFGLIAELRRAIEQFDATLNSGVLENANLFFLNSLRLG